MTTKRLLSLTIDGDSFLAVLEVDAPPEATPTETYPLTVRVPALTLRGQARFVEGVVQVTGRMTQD